jgi:RNA polymerase sigma factor (sigma-70 family)
MDRTCETCVESYLRRYGWELVERDALLAAVEDECRRRGGGPAAARAATLLCYSRALYHACSGAEGPERQERGYAELYGFLGRAASRRYGAVAADATQRAVEQIYFAFGRCRQPETFLAFALQKLRDGARAEIRDSAQRADHLPDDLGDPGDSGLAAAATAHGDPAAAAERAALRGGLARCAEAFVARHPRAARQFAAVWLKYIAGLDDQEIGRRLGRSAAAVQVLRSRALRRLRAEPAWRQLASELGIA